MPIQKFISVSAVVFRNEKGEVLTVRKRGTRGFMLPGGKPEEGEGSASAAVREVQEELNFEVSRDDLQYIGTFITAALNEPGYDVRAHVFEWEPVDTGALNLLADLTPSAEIDEFRWVHPVNGPLDLQAPLNINAVFPALENRPCKMEIPAPVETVEHHDAIAVFCGASMGSDEIYAKTARELGAACAARKIDVVYGGGRAGLMGEVSAGAHEAGGKVFGVIPRFLVDAEQANTSICHLEIVDTMHERKARMAELTDAFVALPGGPGTLEEFFEVWTWAFLGVHQKPVALLNINGYWNPLLAMIDSMVEQGFVKAAYLERLLIADTVDELLDLLQS
ncbi:MAG: TIGR00730 family Rossman fold protein [Rothia sp. (in: high G+C Gram-positive bacteria)]|nr:TIGR00730 family Rossman fold protein [Rothia sp. (in: high G+C Gram-positive bacteria)]